MSNDAQSVPAPDPRVEAATRELMRSDVMETHEEWARRVLAAADRATRNEESLDHYEAVMRAEEARDGAAPPEELHEGCERRGGICDCAGRPCAVDAEAAPDPSEKTQAAVALAEDALSRLPKQSGDAQAAMYWLRVLAARERQVFEMYHARPAPPLQEEQEGERGPEYERAKATAIRHAEERDREIARRARAERKYDEARAERDQWRETARDTTRAHDSIQAELERLGPLQEAAEEVVSGARRIDVMEAEGYLVSHAVFRSLDAALEQENNKKREDKVFTKFSSPIEKNAYLEAEKSRMEQEIADLQEQVKRLEEYLEDSGRLKATE